MRTHEIFLGTTLRGLKLAGLSVGVALLAGGATVYAAAPAQATVAEAAATAVPSPAPAPAQAEPAAPAQADPAATPQANAAAPAQAAAAGSTQPGAKKKKVKQKKEKPPKLIPMHIAEGTLTVDGWTGKARLNYDIADLKYIYVWAPGIGTIVASNSKFPTGKEEPGAFNGNNLTLDAGGHTVQISSDTRLLKAKKPSSAWVYVDTSYHRPSGYPEMGYGPGKDAPYAWPGSRQVSLDSKGAVEAPPLPAGLRPSMEKAGCATPTPTAPSTTAQPAASTAVAPCPASSPGAKPAQTPPAPLPGYRSTAATSAEVSVAPAAVQ